MSIKKTRTTKECLRPLLPFRMPFILWHGKRWPVQANAYLLAEGLIDGKVVASDKRYASGQADHIVVRLDHEKIALKADGSDVVTVIAEIVDKRGTIKRLNNSSVRFELEGEGRLLGDASVGANPRQVVWGTAPVLVQSTTNPGKITVRASLQNPGQSRPLEGVLEFETVTNDQKEIFSASELSQSAVSQAVQNTSSNKSDLERENERLRKELNQLKVKEVEKQQTQFGVGIND